MKTYLKERLKNLNPNITPTIIHEAKDKDLIFFIGSVEYLHPKTQLKLFKSQLFSFHTKSQNLRTLATASRKRYSFIALGSNTLIATGYKSIQLIDTSNLSRNFKLDTKHKHQINCACFSTDNKLIVSGSGSASKPYDFSVKVSDIDSGKLIFEKKIESAPFIKVKLDNDNNVWALDNSHCIYKWNLNGELLLSQKPKGISNPRAISNITNLFHGVILNLNDLVISAIEGYLYVWKISTGDVLAKSDNYCKDAFFKDDKTINYIDFQGKSYALSIEKFV